MKSQTPVLAMILKGYPRISETFIANEILLLEELGFRIHIISMRKPRESFTHEMIAKIQARVDYLPSNIRDNKAALFKSNLRALVKQPGRYLKAALKAGRRYLRVRKSATWKHLLQAGFVVDRILPGNDVTHLHAHFAHSPTSVAMFTSMISGLPFSFTAHAKDIYTSDPEQLGEKIRQARFAATCTEYNRRHLLGLVNPGCASLHRVYHGIDVGFFHNDAPRPRAEQPYQLLTVARMTAKKGLPTVYRAIRMLRDEGLDVRHTLIGDGDDRDEILGLVHELGLDDAAEWLGTQPHQVVLDRFRQSDLFVLGCEIIGNGDRDGIPNVLVESLAMGVPAAATNVSGIPELIEDGRTGLLAPPGDPAALAAVIKRLLTDEELRKTVIAAGREKVEREFDNRRLIRDLADIYISAGIRPAGSGGPS